MKNTEEPTVSMAMTERTYMLGGDLVRESEMAEWHNSRGIPWGPEFNGPDPVTIRKMREPDNLTVHLANEHGTGADLRGGFDREIAHARAHMHGKFRKGQEHYHAEEFS